MKGAELLGFFQMCLKMGMDEMLVQEMYKRTDRINERGGPQPKDYETVSAFVFEMDRLKLQPFFERLFIDPYREWVKDVEGSTPHIGLVRKHYNFILHIFDKPFGYNGDGGLLRKMYEAHEKELFDKNGTPWAVYVSSPWDKFIMARPEMTGLQQRKAIFHHITERWIFNWPMQTPLRVLDLGCGDGTFMKHLSITAHNHNVPLDITGVDQDQRSLQYAAEHNLKPQCSDKLSVGYIGSNAFDFLRKGVEVDMVYATGLFDYFSDALFERMLKIIWATGAKHILIGNINQCMKTKAMMSVLGWHLHDRRASRLLYLAENALWSEACVLGTATDFTETQLFLTVERNKS